MNLLGVGIHYQYIIKGLVLVAAVAFDIQTRKKRK
jgi:putative multiple sugar transport system permease protein